MSVIRLLNNGSWSKPPVLTAARKILIDGLASAWQRTELGDLATFVNGTSYDRDLLVDSGTPIIRISNMTDPRSEYLTTNQSFDNRYIAQPNDLLVSWSASFKSVIWSGPAGVLNQHIFKVTEKPGNHRGFIRHAIEAVFDDMQSKVVGIGMMHLRRRDFLGYQVPAPDYHTQEAVCHFLDWLEMPDNQPEPTLPDHLSEQRRIVARIEELAARIEEARGLRRQAVEEAEAILGAATLPIFDSNREVMTSVKQMVGRSNLRNGKSLKTTDEPSEVSCLTLSSLRQGTVDCNNVKPVPMTEAEANPFLVQSQDVFVVRGNGSKQLVGQAGVVQDQPERVIFPDLFIKIPLDTDTIMPRFFVAMWNSKPMRDNLEATAKTTSGIWKINQGHVASFSVPLPPISEQRRIVAYLDYLQAKVDSLKRLQTETAAELDALLPSVLDRAFKGDL
jgi:type I restriction enzyme S subunit